MKKQINDLYKLTPGTYLMRVDPLKLTEEMSDMLLNTIRLLNELDIYVFVVLAPKDSIEFFKNKEKEGK